MERRNLLAGLAVLALSLFVLSGTALAHTRPTTRRPSRGRRTVAPETCSVNTLPASSWTRASSATSSSVADIIEVECEPVYAEQPRPDQRQRALQPLHEKLHWTNPHRNQPEKNISGFTSGAELQSDARQRRQRDRDRDRGPSCAAGESLVSAHLTKPPYTTVTTGFTCSPPKPTPAGVIVTPTNKVEGEEYSDVATIVQVEFPPVFAEERSTSGFSQLKSRCKYGRARKRSHERRGPPRTSSAVSEDEP